MFEEKIKSKVNLITKNLKEELKKELKKELKEEIESENKKELEAICFNFIKLMFDNKYDEKCILRFGRASIVKTIGGDFKERAIAAVKNENKKECKIAAKNEVLSDDFIVEIVKRINKMQLKT